MGAFKWGGVVLLVLGVALTVVGAVGAVPALLIVGPTLAFTGAVFVLVGRAVAPAVEAASELARSQGAPDSFGVGSVNQQLEHAQGRMAGAVEQMAAFNADHGERQRLEAVGVKGTGTVKSLQDTGAKRNLNPVYSVELVVASDQHRAYDVSIQSEIPTIAVAAVAVGDERPVRIDPADPRKVLVNWMGVI